MNPLVAKHKKMLMLIGIGTVCLLLAVTRWYFSYSSSGSYGKEKGNAAKTQEIPAVNVFLVKKVNFIENLTMTGTIQGGARVECRFNRDGRISRINYNVGDKVSRGAVIAELDTGEAAIKKQQAEAELSQTIDLYKAGAVAKPRLTQAQLAAELARKEYERSFIRAPRDGAIGEINAEVGEIVTPQTTVASLVSTDNVFVEMGVIEKDLSKLHMNQTVNIEVETYPGLVFKGRIARIAPVVEGTSRTRMVRAEISNEKGVLLPGMFARTKIFVQEKPNTMVIPATAVQENAGQKKVFVVLASNKLESRKVDIGYESADYSEVIAGLSENEKVVETIGSNLREGIPVELLEEKSYEETNGDHRNIH